ncbi:MAG: T9SS type A sorting domain-containing protein [Ignavibacteria bacterium]|nr:T9SS type A sorting domain-containing protein [Ignavibacteria bacterium]
MYNLLQSERNFENTPNCPENYRLYQNFPQSFYKFTKIAFDIPTQSNVRIVIYDVFGQDKAELCNTELKAGSYEIKWQAAGFKAGVYYYKLFAGEFVDVKKILIINN